MNSIQGRLDQLTNSWQQMWSNAISSDIAKFFITTADSLVQLIDRVGLLSSAFTILAGGIALIKSDSLIASLAKISDAVKVLPASLAEAGAGAQTFSEKIKSIPQGISGAFGKAWEASYKKVTGFGSSLTDVASRMEALSVETIDLNTVMKNHGVTMKDLEKVLGRDFVNSLQQSYKAEELKTLATNIDTVATERNQVAHTGLIATLKSYITVENAARLAVTAGVMAITFAITQAIKAYKDHQRELRETLESAYDTAKTSANATIEIAKATHEYRVALASDDGSEEAQMRLSRASDKVVEALGDKADALKDVVKESDAYERRLQALIDAEERQAEATRGTSKALWEKAKNEAIAERDALEKVLEDEYKDVNIFKGTTTKLDIEIDAKSPSWVKDLIESLDSDGQNSFSDGLSTYLTLDPSSIKSVSEYYLLLQKITEEIIKQSDTHPEWLDSDFYNQVQANIKKLQEQDYGSSAVDAYYKEAYTKAVAELGVPETVAEFEALKGAVLEAAEGSEVLAENFENRLNVEFGNLVDLSEQLDAALEHLTNQEKNKVTLGKDQVYVNKELREAYDEYIKIQKEIQQAGIDLTKTEFGNIDLNNRQVLEWNKQKLDQYREVLRDSWGYTEDEINSLLGSISTVLGSSATYDGIDIAFSPMLQGDNGQPELLSAEAVDKYILAILDKVRQEHPNGFSSEDILNLDAEGLEIDGKVIKGIIADVGETARQTGEQMHYLGQDGAYENSLKVIDQAAKDAGVSVESLMEALAKDRDLKTVYDAVDAFREAEALNKEINSGDNTLFGNVSLVDRGAIEWTRKTLLQYRDVIMSWEDENADFQDVIKDMEGTFSTAMMRTGTFGSDGLETNIVFSPMLRTAEGSVPLSKETVTAYMEHLIKKAQEYTEQNGGDFEANLLNLDQEGFREFEQDGVRIKNVVAGVGEAYTEMYAQASARENYVNASKQIDSLAEKTGATREEVLALADAWKEKIDPVAYENILQVLEEDEEKLSLFNQMMADSEYAFDGFIGSVDDLVEALETYQHWLDQSTRVSDKFIDEINTMGEAIDNFQSTVSSMGSIIESAFSGSFNASNYIDQLQSIAQAIGTLPEDAAKKLSAAFNGLEYGNLEQLNVLAKEVARETLNALLDKLAETTNPQLIQGLRTFSNEFLEMQFATKGAVTGLNSLASAYGTLNDAIYQYNTDGVMTISTITSLLELEPQYLDLLEMENGKLQLNEQGLRLLVKARIDNAKAAAIEESQARINTIIFDAETEAKERNTEASRQGTEEEQKYADALLATGKAAGMSSIDLLNYAKVKAKEGGVSLTESHKKEIEAEQERLNKRIQMYDSMYRQISSGSQETRDKIMGYSNKTAEDAKKQAEDAAKEIKSNIDGLLSAWKKAVDEGGMTYRQYLQQMKSLTDKYYREGKLSYKDYIDYQHQYYQGVVDMWKQAGSAIQNYIARQKDALQEQIDELNEQKEAYQKQIDAIEKYYQGLIDIVEAETEMLQGQKELIEEQVTAIEKEYKRLLDPLEQQNKLLSEQKELVEEQIDAIERRYGDLTAPLEKQVETLSDWKEGLEEQIDTIERYYDKLIQPLEKQNKELKKQKEELEEQVAIIEERYEKMLDPLNKSIKGLEKETKAIEKQIKAYEKLIDKIEARYKVELDAIDKEIEGYQEIIESINEQVSAYEKAIEPFQKQIDLLEEQQALYRKQIHALQDIQKENSIIIRDLEHQKEPYQNQIDALNAQKQALQDANDERSKAIALQRAQYELERARNQRSVRQYSGGQYTYVADSEAVRSANEQLDTLRYQASIDAIDKKIKELQKPIDAIQKRIDEITKKNNALSEQIEDIEILIDKIDHKIEPFQEKIDAYNKSIEALKKKIAAINENIDKLEKRGKELKKQQDAETSAIQVNIDKLKEQKETLDEQVETLQERVDALEEARDLETEIYKREIEAIDKQTAALDKKISALEEARDKALEVHQQEAQALEDQINTIEKQIKTLERAKAEELAVFETQRQALEDEIAVVEKQIRTLEAARDTEIGILQEQTAAIQEQIDALGKKTAAYEKARDADVAAVQAEIDKLDQQTEAINRQITALEKYAKQWANVADTWERIKEEKLLEELFGKDWQDRINSLDPTILQKFADEYLKACEQLANHNQIVIDSLDQVEQKAGTTAQAAKEVTGILIGGDGGGGNSPGSGGSKKNKADDIVRSQSNSKSNRTNTINNKNISVTDSGTGSRYSVHSTGYTVVSAADEASGALQRLIDWVSSLKNKVPGAKSDLQGVKTNVDNVGASIKKAGDNASGAASKVDKFGNSAKDAGNKSHTAADKMDKVVRAASNDNKISTFKQIVDKAKTSADEAKKRFDAVKSIASNAKTAVSNVKGTLDNTKTSARNAETALRNVANQADRTDTKLSGIKRIVDKVKNWAQDAKDAIEDLGRAREASSRREVYSTSYTVVPRYAKGGRVEVPTAATGRRVRAAGINDLFNAVARALGEDTMVAAKEGEGIFTKKQTDDLEKFIKLTPELISATESLTRYSKLMTPLFGNMTEQVGRMQDRMKQASGMDNSEKNIKNIETHQNNFSMQIGDIHIAHTNNVSNLAQQIKNNMPNAMLQALMAT